MYLVLLLRHALVQDADQEAPEDCINFMYSLNQIENLTSLTREYWFLFVVDDVRFYICYPVLVFYCTTDKTNL